MAPCTTSYSNQLIPTKELSLLGRRAKSASTKDPFITAHGGRLGNLCWFQASSSSLPRSLRVNRPTSCGTKALSLATTGVELFKTNSNYEDCRADRGPSRWNANTLFEDRSTPRTAHGEIPSEPFARTPFEAQIEGCLEPRGLPLSQAALSTTDKAPKRTEL
jgi:hypothetical protein